MNKKSSILRISSVYIHSLPGYRGIDITMTDMRVKAVEGDQQLNINGSISAASV